MYRQDAIKLVVFQSYRTRRVAPKKFQKVRQIVPIFRIVIVDLQANLLKFDKIVDLKKPNICIIF